MIRCIVFDLDDTLLHNDLSISCKTISVLHQLSQHGIKIIPASGRAPESMKPFLQKLGCADAAIASNGAELLDTEGNVIWRQILDQNTAHSILDFAADHHCYAHTYEGAAFHYQMIGSKWAEAYQRSSLLTGVHENNLHAFVDKHPTNKILLINESRIITTLFQDALRIFSGKASVSTSKPQYLEFNPFGTSKGNALTMVMQQMKVPMEQVCAFGDGINDISMLQAAGLGIAMGNASAEVQNAADAVCMTNEEDGIAQYLEAHAELFELTLGLDQCN